MKRANVQLHFTTSGKWALYKDDHYKPFRSGTAPAELINEFIIGLLITLSCVAWVEIRQVDDEIMDERLR